MELRKSKTRTLIPVFIVLLLLRFWYATAQTLDQNHHRTSSQPPVNSPTGEQSPPSIISNPIVTRFKDLLLNRTRKKRVNRANMEFLNAHNLVRRRVGEPPFSWNKQLAQYARAWAKKRVDDCRLVHSNGPYGENIFWGGRNHWRPRDVVKIWADEYKYYDQKANTCEPRQMCGHYTQIVWRESTKVGCARAACSNGGVYVICAYNPPGNYEGENPFGTYKDQTGYVRTEPPETVAEPPYAAGNGLRTGM